MIVNTVSELGTIRDRFVSGLTQSIEPVDGLIGFDGFIDTFVRLNMPSTMADFGPKVAAAAGIATSFPVTHGGDHFGGNGPLISLGLSALLGERSRLHYIGGIGAGALHPIFEIGFAGRMASLHPVASPAQSTCLEFDDGKVMLSDMSSCSQITWDAVLKGVGEAELDRLLKSARFVGAVNWGKLPFAGDVWIQLVRRMKSVGVEAKKVTMFMDLAEFEHRPSADVEKLLVELPEITSQCRSILSLNLKEAWQLAAILGSDFSGKRGKDDLLEITRFLRDAVAVDRLIVHPNDGAACSDGTTVSYVPGPVCKLPYRSTGAGDHFGAGSLAAAALGLDDVSILLAGVCTSGYFVRSGRSPCPDDLTELLDQWIAGTLPDQLVE